MTREFQNPVSSQEDLNEETTAQEMLNILNEKVKTDGGTGTVSGSYSDFECAGNTSYECVRRSVNQIGEILGDERDDWVAIGGLVPQLQGLERMGEDSAVFMKVFGNRTTNDFDILTTSPGELRSKFREAGYNQDGDLLKIDYVGPDVIPEAENILEPAPEEADRNEYAHYESFSGYSDPEIDARLRVPSDTDLFYTKVHDQASRESAGTSSDAEFMAQSGHYDIDDDRLRELVGGEREVLEYVERIR